MKTPMRRVDVPGDIQFVVIGALLSLGLLLILSGSELATQLMILLLPFMALGVLISLGYMVYVYYHLLPPRPLFLSMLIGATAVKLIAALGIGYIAAASLADRIGLDLPLPLTPTQRASFVALSIIAILTPPIYYALMIYIGRRKTGNIE